MNTVRTWLILTPIALALAACGGGGGGSDTTSTSGSGTVSLVVTDNLTLDYAEVWVTVEKITATDNQGNTVTLYQDTTGQAINLSQLANIGALIDAQTIPAATYTQFNITLANNISLVAAVGGAQTNATFDQTGNASVVFNVNGSLVVAANQPTSLVLDFDLARFTYNATTNTVDPTIVQTTAPLNQTVATMQGTIQAVANANQLTLTPATGGAAITVKLHAQATVVNTINNTLGTDFTGLQAGQSVIISGIYDAATLTLTARHVLHGSSQGINARHEVEGIVVSFDGANMTLNVEEASFIPGSNVIGIANTANAFYSAGSVAMIAVGQQIEYKGNWDGTTFTAVFGEIDGAPRNGGSYVDDYAEIEGNISVINGDTVSLLVSSSEHVNGINQGDTVTIDVSSAWFKEGNRACLTSGAQIEAKGGMTDATSMMATTVEFDACGNS